MENLERAKFLLEFRKVGFDVIKHVSTLASGSIVIIIAFLDKIPKPIHHGNLLEAALRCFLGCIVLCVVVLMLAVPRNDYLDVEAPPKNGLMLRVFQLLAFGVFGTFIVGMSYLTAFGIATIPELSSK